MVFTFMRRMVPKVHKNFFFRKKLISRPPGWLNLKYQTNLIFGRFHGIWCTCISYGCGFHRFFFRNLLFTHTWLLSTTQWQTFSFFLFFLFFKFFIKVAHFSIAGFLVSPLSRRYIVVLDKRTTLLYPGMARA